MMEQHALDQEAVEQAPIWLLPVHQLTEKQLQATIKCSSIVEGPARHGAVEDVCFSNKNVLTADFVIRTGFGVKIHSRVV